MIPLVVAAAFFMEQLDSTIITTAVPDIARSLHVTSVQMSLAVAAYVLAVAVFIPVSGWFADRFGARRVFVLALAVFTLGSILCGLAQSFAMLVAMRIVQGLGGAMMTPVGRLILLRSFPRSELMTAMTYVTLPAILGPVIGPLLGGILTTYLSWHWIFYVNVPFGLVGMLLASRYVENVRDPAVRGFDFPGFLMIGGGLGLFQFGMENVSRPIISPVTIALTIGAAMVLLVGFGFYARRAAAPAIDLSLFQLRSFRIGTLAGGLCRIGMNGVPFLLPLMLQVGFGLSPVASGSITFVGSIGAVFIRSLLAPVLRRHGFRLVLAGSAIAGSIVLAGFALIGPQTPHWIILLAVFLLGLTRSAQFMTSNTLSYSDMPDGRLSRATSLGGVLQQLSVSFGVSVSAVLLSVVSLHSHALTPARFHEAFALTAIIPLLALPGFLALRPQDGGSITRSRQVVAEAEGRD
ncbi:MAG TPA: DHA2 family efflux MFS transporter permease subunit [Rhizomicrobium sp.]